MAPNRDEVVRVRLRYPDQETFVEKFAPNVTRGGIFLASREPRPVGTVLRFEVSLRDGAAMLTGRGRVTWVKNFIPSEPHRPYGMGVQFISLDPDSLPVLDQILRRREATGRPGTGPHPVPAAAGAGGSDGRPSAPASRAYESIDEIEETAVRRLVDRARTLSARTDDVEGLLAPEPPEKVTLSDALADLPRILAGGRRPTGAYRPLGENASDGAPDQASQRDAAGPPTGAAARRKND